MPGIIGSGLFRIIKASEIPKVAEVSKSIFFRIRTAAYRNRAASRLPAGWRLRGRICNCKTCSRGIRIIYLIKPFNDIRKRCNLSYFGDIFFCVFGKGIDCLQYIGTDNIALFFSRND